MSALALRSITEVHCTYSGVYSDVVLRDCCGALFLGLGYGLGMIIDKLKNADTVGAVAMAGSFGALWGTIAVGICCKKFIIAIF